MQTSTLQFYLFIFYLESRVRESVIRLMYEPTNFTPDDNIQLQSCLKGESMN